MNDKFTDNMNREDEIIGQKLDRVANQTNISSQFAAELEERLRIAHQPKISWFASSLKQVSPALLWVGLVILIGLVLNWSIKSLIPAPQPATDNTPVNSDIATLTPDIAPNETATHVTKEGGFDWRGTKLYLSVPLPQLPTNAKVYSLKDEQPATVDVARALATQFGIQGNIYETPGRLAAFSGYLVTDDKQRLYVHSALNYDYYSEYSNFSFLSGGKNISNEQASAAIDAFMKAHGMDFEYQIENAHQIPGSFYVVPLTPDGLPVRYDYNMPSRFEFTVNDDGQVVLMSSCRVDYDLVGTYDIRTAEEAFQQVLGSSNVIQDGVLEITYPGGILNEYFWQRAYPDIQTVTIYGQPIVYPAAKTEASPFVSIGQYTATGNVNGIENIDPSTYVEAIGQFTTENGIRIFDIENWRISDATSYNTTGSLRRKENGEVVLWIWSGREYPIPNAPEDAPLNTVVFDENPPLWVSGLMTEDGFYWQTIQYYPDGALNQSGGGGGGGGTGFYKLNLSGTPVPFPTPTLEPETNQGTVEYVIKEGDTLFAIAEAYGITPEKIIQANDWLSEGHALMPGKMLIIPDSQVDPSPVGQRIAGLRGTLAITIYKKPDGGQRIEYILNPKSGETSLPPMLLEGDNLQDLLSNQARPLDIWGTLDHYDNDGRPVVKVERYEIPYPDLQIQLFQGTQENISLDGQIVTMFTSNDGQKYVLLYPNGDLDETTVDPEKPQLILEAMAIPNESYGGYPTLRYFNGGLAIDPMTGSPTEFSVTADRPYIIEEPLSPENYIPPTTTIEKVELVYYIPDPQRTPPDSNSGPRYIQPAWRFYGHYSNGDEFEILVQALKQEYLLPELAPYTPPG